ncbi:MAG: hypothetical protein HON98_13205 [Chloroflexi bacterium]|jgi:RNA polymerase sigma-54 factor|nr:hypothetical protein [Chloroflexota bacterium]MBT4003391.1 hypothetical protein [Chloroflexota bacterium]MBT4305914.1 hypothetical protein [Chloroflexota bacterium]MBT4533739.1 hypothetical protein [Chloroflexota bacterium]MBT4681618.1 hypothetical protein [Chloroflexota bacterium]
MVNQRFVPRQNTSHKALTTAHLAQTMTLLALNNQELLEKIQGELATNPALDLNETNHCPTCQRIIKNNSYCPNCSHSASNEDPVVFVSSREDISSSRNSNDIISDDEFTSQQEDLPTYVLRQIATELEIDERALAAHILSSLDEDGLSTTSNVEVARYHHVSLSKVEKVMELINKSDPIGVGCSSPKAALLTQLDMIDDGQFIDPLTYKVIDIGLDNLSKNQYELLSKKLGVTIQRIEKISSFISSNLNPYPGRAFWGNVRHQENPTLQRYKNPDVIINIQGDPNDPQFIVEVMWPIRGTLKLNPAFKKAMAEAPENKSGEWKEAIEKANLLIKCLIQRNHTLVQLMQKLSVLQRDYILKGDAYIKPITRAKLAKEIGVHESTISRAVSSKSAQLPSGKIVPISIFFDRSLHIRTALKEIIANEEKPLSDTKLVKLLSEYGYDIARRTVAKYRSVEGILPAHLRNSQ